jgi:hypothetical protein
VQEGQICIGVDVSSLTSVSAFAAKGAQAKIKGKARIDTDRRSTNPDRARLVRLRILFVAVFPLQPDSFIALSIDPSR